MSNAKLKQAIKSARLKQWEVAQQVGVSEMTLIRWFRTEMTEERKERVYKAIEALKGEQ